MTKRNKYAKIKYLYATEKETLFTVIKNDTSRHALRNYAVFLLAEYAGLRASELGMITESEINIENKEIYFKRLKGSNSNTLRILDPVTFETLIKYIKFKHEKGSHTTYLFTSQKGNPISRKTLNTIMKRYCKEANISDEKAHFHVLKHTRAIELGEMGLDTKEVQYWLGHKSIKSTEVYLQFTTKQQDILYNKLNPYYSQPEQ